jgi:adenylyltransferase/sulfurtransferase
MKLSYIKDQEIALEICSVFSRRLLNQIYSLARSNYPHECCGLILKQGIKPCKNIQEELHQSDPINYPRNTTEGFVLSSEDLLFLSRNISSENPVKVIYHSHPDVGAYFSDEDKNNALFEGEPVYPVDHLVIDIQKDKVICSKLFRFIEGDYQLIAVFSGEKI